VVPTLGRPASGRRTCTPLDVLHYILATGACSRFGQGRLGPPARGGRRTRDPPQVLRSWFEPAEFHRRPRRRPPCRRVGLGPIAWPNEGAGQPLLASAGACAVALTRTRTDLRSTAWARNLEAAGPRHGHCGRGERARRRGAATPAHALARLWSADPVHGRWVTAGLDSRFARVRPTPSTGRKWWRGQGRMAGRRGCCSCSATAGGRARTAGRRCAGPLVVDARPRLRDAAGP